MHAWYNISLGLLMCCQIFGDSSHPWSCAGVATSGLTTAALALKRKRNPGFQPSVPAVTSVGTASAGWAVTGFYQHLRLQSMGGMDRWLFEHINALPVYLLWSTMARMGSGWAVSKGRCRALGLPMWAPQRQQPAAAATASQQPLARKRKARKAGSSKPRRVAGSETRERSYAPA